MNDKLENLNIEEIKKIITNRYPYLLIDKAIEVLPGTSSKGYKNLTANEWFFPVHFPEDPIMPGMLQMEALLQMLSLTVLTMEENKGKTVRGLSANKIRLKGHVAPGNRLDIETELIDINDGIGTGRARGTIKGTEVCSAEFVFLLY